MRLKYSTDEELLCRFSGIFLASYRFMVGKKPGVSVYYIKIRGAAYGMGNDIHCYDDSFLGTK